ncbi:dihydroorotase [Granulosicoccaceae sp. 1_MG-2023]|nr:dihydroorotase [Granulosicoccaceae sp. 1_MG-2023]
MTLTLTRPDDWHLHLRDGASLAAVVNHTARQFARAIVMPNLQPPVTTTELASAYRQRILDALDPGLQFEPLMTLYLTAGTSAEEIKKAAASGFVKACKLYPAGATTNSAAGVSDIKAIYPVFEAMQEAGLVLCLHGEVVDPDVDIFDREGIFIERTLRELVRDFPQLRIVLEHITTREAAEFVLSAPDNVGATITPQHIRYNRNHMLVGGIKPHFYCLPIIKRDTHRQKLVEVATSGNPKFFLGTDSAPHGRHAKETACGCAGMYSAHAAIELYAEVFEEQNALDKLEGFASLHGADFYGLPRNSDTITLRKCQWQVPDSYPFGDGEVVPMKAGETLSWQLQDNAG